MVRWQISWFISWCEFYNMAYVMWGIKAYMIDVWAYIIMILRCIANYIYWTISSNSYDVRYKGEYQNMNRNTVTWYNRPTHNSKRRSINDVRRSFVSWHSKQNHLKWWEGMFYSQKAFYRCNTKEEMHTQLIIMRSVQTNTYNNDVSLSNINVPTGNWWVMKITCLKIFMTTDKN